MPSKNAALMHRWFDEVWVQGKTAAMEGYLAPGCVLHHLSQGRKYRGLAGFHRLHREYSGAFGKIRCTIHETIEQDDRIAVRWTFSGVPTAPARGATGRRKRVAMPVTTIVRLKGGRMVEAWDSFDSTIAQQIVA